MNVEREKLEYGEVEEWEKTRARELGRKARTRQAYPYLAESLEDEKVALSFFRLQSLMSMAHRHGPGQTRLPEGHESTHTTRRRQNSRCGLHNSSSLSSR